MSEPQLCVIIPAFNEAALIGRTLERVQAALPRASIIVVDGGSTDETAAIAARAGATIVQAPRGRGIQCHAGALRATADWLLFLHADTLVPLEAERVFQAFAANPAAQIGTFRLQFADGGRLLNTLAWAASRRDSVFTRFGDQGILVRRSFYETIGGFPPWPLFEDVALFQTARKLSRVHWLPAHVITSARRFNERGLFRQRLLNAELMLRYLAGASPFDLAARYHAHAGRRARRDFAESVSPVKADLSSAGCGRLKCHRDKRESPLDLGPGSRPGGDVAHWRQELEGTLPPAGIRATPPLPEGAAPQCTKKPE
jgi:rSAM/selenodomain-associated transferase 2